MKENKDLKLQSFSEKMEKEAVRMLEKYERAAEKRLEKAQKQNPRNHFFTQTFPGKKISSFCVHRHFRRAQKFYTQNLMDEAKKELQLAMKWEPLFAPSWVLKGKIELENKATQDDLEDISDIIEGKYKL